MRREQTQVLLTTVACSMLCLLLLSFLLQLMAAPPGVLLAQQGDESTPTTVTSTVTLEVSPTLTPTTPTETPTPTPSLTPTPTVTPTHTPTSTPTPTATLMPSPSPTLTPAPPSPEPSVASPPAPEGFVAQMMENPLLLAGVLVGLLGLLFLVLLVILLGGRKRRQRKRTGTRPIKAVTPAGAPAPPVPARLVSVDVEGKAQTFVLAPEGVAIGRAEDNALVIGATFPGWESVSRHHARIFRQGEDWIVTDLNSRNGIYVNDQRTGRNLLRDGWRLRIGSVTFTFRAGKGA